MWDYVDTTHANIFSLTRYMAVSLSRIARGADSNMENHFFQFTAHLERSPVYTEFKCTYHDSYPETNVVFLQVN